MAAGYHKRRGVGPVARRRLRVARRAPAVAVVASDSRRSPAGHNAPSRRNRQVISASVATGCPAGRGKFEPKVLESVAPGPGTVASDGRRPQFPCRLVGVPAGRRPGGHRASGNKARGLRLQAGRSRRGGIAGRVVPALGEGLPIPPTHGPQAPGTASPQPRQPDLGHRRSMRFRDSTRWTSTACWKRRRRLSRPGVRSSYASSGNGRSSVFVADRATLTHRLYSHRGGRLALEFCETTGSVTNLLARRLK